MATKEATSVKDGSVPSPPKEVPCTLPREKVFSIQIGTELFRLSGASIASDAPSYFSHFFEEQMRQNADGANTRTLYIDRDPCTFKEIARHLQGYHVQPKDSAQFVKLFADAQFYSLPRLLSQLFESEITIQIGDRQFHIPRDIFSGPGDSPNFFSLGFGAFFASPSEVFPGLARHDLLRPPAIIPPCIPSRSDAVFAELIHLLRGYPLHIKNEDHRAELLRDCRYFHLRGLEQKLIPHHISFNPIRQRSEIVIRLDDVRPSGIQFSPDDSAAPSEIPSSGWVMYSRPFVDDKSHDLIAEIGDESTIIDLVNMRATFLNLAKARISSLMQVIANKMNLPNKTSLSSSADIKGKSAHPPTSVESVRIRFEYETDCVLNGESISYPDLSTMGSVPDAKHADSVSSEPPAKRKRLEESGNESRTWIVWNGHWRLRVQPCTRGDGHELVLVAVKLDGYTGQRRRNKARPFLGS